ncbi:MAG TPA: hypothetical protein VI298_01660 [Geobacteraceae bacterium]
MKRIELNDHEAEILAGILEFYLSELRMEIVDTKRVAMREAMKGEESFVKDLLDRLKGGESA